jgi:hypothetical protein
MLNRLFITFVLIALVNTSCSQNRTYLTKGQTAWNPYKTGQVLIFGTAEGHTDTLVIANAEDKHFPEGIGAPRNERLEVLVRINSPSVSKRPIEVPLLYISSKTTKDPSEISFKLRLAGGSFWGKPHPINELEKYGVISVKTSYAEFDDVIRIDDNSNQVFREKDIATVFWSKSVGYVKCIKKDGTVWKLISVR